MAKGERLLPNLFDVTSRNGVTIRQSPSEIRGGGTAGARAAQTVVIGGSPTAGSTGTVSVKGKSVTATLTASETTTALAAAFITAAINADPVLNRMVFATVSASTITLTATSPGSVLNSAAVVGSGTGITVTPGGGTMTGGTGNTVTPLEDAQFTYNGVTVYLREGHTFVADTAMLAAVAASGIDAV